MNPRQRRLAADWEAIRGEYSGHDAVTVQPVGPNPYEEYLLTYRLPGLRRENDRPVIEEEHQVRVQLPLAYPRESPYCTPVSEVFHPNVDEHYCIGDYWAAGESLADIIAKIGDMLQYRIYNTQSPLNGVAANYASEHENLFPLGNVDLRSPDVEITSSRD